MCYATTVCSTRVVRVHLCVRSFGSGFLPTYESREVSTLAIDVGTELGSLDGLFDGSNDGKLEVLLIWRLTEIYWW